MRAEESNDDSESEDKLPEDLLSKLELGRPSELMILKEVRDIVFSNEIAFSSS